MHHQSTAFQCFSVLHTVERFVLCLIAASFCDSHGDALLCAESCEPVVKAETVVAVGLSQPAMVVAWIVRDSVARL